MYTIKLYVLFTCIGIHSKSNMLCPFNNTLCVIGRHTTLHTLYELGVLYMGTFDMRDLVLHR